MGRQNGVSLILIAEDTRPSRFIQAILKKLNVNIRSIDVQIAPSGKGSGKAWVENETIRQRKVLRSKNYQENLCLIVATDADNESVAQRKQKILAGTKREKAEKVCLLISKWSIETWLLHFRGTTVTEDKKLKRQYENSVSNKSIKYEANSFVDEFKRYQKGEEFQTLPSLKEAYHELSIIVALL